MRDASYWIEKLGLTPHPEGGFYRETYRSKVVLPQVALPVGFSGPRTASTAIYFLIGGENFSAFHRIRSDELWHFYAGSTLTVYVIDPAGVYSQLRIGDGDFQGFVKAGCWFGCRVEARDGYALVGCTVAPGFDFADFELADRAELTRRFPQHRQIIEQLTRVS